MRRKYGETTFVLMVGIAVTGIHTEVGKSVVATALSAGLGWKYWKPIQTGTPKDTDIAKMRGVPVVDAAYELEFPGAPILAARMADTQVDWDTLLKRWYAVPKPVVVEGAGGLFVPITPDRFFIDLFKVLDCPLVLVVRPYLGAINHTWLSLRAILDFELKFLGIVLCGSLREPSEEYFRERFAEILLGEIPFYEGALPSAGALYEKHLAEGLKKSLIKPANSLSKKIFLTF